MWNSLSNINYYERLLDGNGEEQDVDLSQICRTCMRDAPDSNNLSKDFEIGAMNINLGGSILKLIDMVKEVTGLEVQEDDGFPNQICNNCIQNVSGAYFFRLQSRKAVKILSRLIENSIPNKNIDKNIEYDKHDDNEYSEEIDNIEMVVSENEEIIEEEIELKYNECQLNDIHTEFPYEINQDNIIDKDIIEYIDYVDDKLNTPNECANVVPILKNDEEENSFVKKEDETSSRNEVHSCPECYRKFKRKKELAEHLRIDHPYSKAFECELCHSRFTNPQSLKRHSKIHQADQKNKLCTFCGKCFTRADDLKRHIRIHTGECPYFCTICSKRYKQTSELKEHMISHSKERTFVCNICGKILFTRNGYYVHMKVHKGVRNHVCPFCGNRYVTSGELNSHIRHIHEKIRPYVCTFEKCNKTFKSKMSLNIHQRVHTGFSCADCGKKLASLESLTEHIKTHDIGNKVTCDICNITFVNAQILKKHKKIHIDHSPRKYSKRKKPNADTVNDVDGSNLKQIVLRNQYNITNINEESNDQIIIAEDSEINK